MVTPYHFVAVEGSTWLSVAVFPFRVMDLKSNWLLAVLWTWITKWFQALFTGLQGIPVGIHRFVTLFQMSHSCPPAMRHSCPQMNERLPVNWLMSNSSACDVGRFFA